MPKRRGNDRDPANEPWVIEKLARLREVPRDSIRPRSVRLPKKDSTMTSRLGRITEAHSG